MIRPLNDVKEPMIPLENGFGYLGVVMYDEEEDKVQCAECGNFYKALRYTHLRKHDLTTSEYKRKFKIAQRVALQGNSTTSKLRENYLKNNPPARRKKLAKLAAKSPRQGHSKAEITMTYKNKKGECPLQLLARLRKIHKEEGKITREIVGQSLYDKVRRTFGTLSKAVELAGFNKYSPSKYTKGMLVRMLQNFVLVHRREPMTSDCKKNRLPCSDTFYNHFGSFTKAKKGAGILDMLNDLS